MPRVLLGLMAALAVAAGPALEDEIAQWRRARASTLQAEGGWLTVAGLFWLHEGANSFGKAPASKIVPPDEAGSPWPASSGCMRAQTRSAKTPLAKSCSPMDPPRPAFSICAPAR